MIRKERVSPPFFLSFPDFNTKIFILFVDFAVKKMYYYKVDVFREELTKMKKPRLSSKSNTQRQGASVQKAENNIVLVNCGVIIYGLVLVLLYMMHRSSSTIEGAIAVIRIFTFGSAIAAMCIAAYSAYVSNKAFLKYSLMCLFITISSAALIYGKCNDNFHAYTVDFGALVLALIFNAIYAILTDKDKYYSNKAVSIAFKTVVGVVYALIFVLLVLMFFDII